MHFFPAAIFFNLIVYKPLRGEPFFRYYTLHFYTPDSVNGCLYGCENKTRRCPIVLYGDCSLNAYGIVGSFALWCGWREMSVVSRMKWNTSEKRFRHTSRCVKRGILLISKVNSFCRAWTEVSQWSRDIS